MPFCRLQWKVLNHSPRLCLTLLLALLPLTVTAQTDLLEPSSYRDLDTGWEYRWGDNPMDGERPAWLATSGQQNGAWHAIDFPSNPPDRNGRHNAWFRVTLPDNQWHDPAIFIYSIDLIAEVYLNGEKIHQFGTFDSNGQGRFVGWPWHLIPLPDEYSGETLYFRVWSDYTDIGLWGEIKIGSAQSLTLRIVLQSAKALLTGGLSLLIGIMALLFAFIGSPRRTFGPVALFALASGTSLVAGAQAVQLVWNQPLFWDYLNAASYFLLPVAAARLLEHWIPENRFRPLRRIWQLHLVYLVLALGLSLAGRISLATTYPVFDALLVVTTALLTWQVFGRWRRLETSQRWLASAFGAYALILLLDMAWAHGFLPENPVPLSWGGLAFLLAVCMIAVFDYHHTLVNLRELNRTLEARVAERTRELADLSYLDGLTGISNRRAFDDHFARECQRAERDQIPLSLLMIDLDRFKEFNDRYGHLAGDHALATLARVLQDRFRATDIVCRYGGEEFVVILPNTGHHEAAVVAESVIARIRITSIHYNDRDLGKLSVSIGIASWPDPTPRTSELLNLADWALYQAKECGRNRLYLPGATGRRPPVQGTG